MHDTRLRDRRGAIRSPATLPGAHAGRIPASKGRSYPAHPFAIEDLVRLLNACKPLRSGPTAELSALRLRALVVTMWRTGLRISEALSLEPRDLDVPHQAITVRCGKGGKRRVTRMDRWGWDHLHPWLDARQELPFGAVFCVITGPTAGLPILANDARRQLRAAGNRAGLRRRSNPHALRHSHAVDLWREGIDVYTIQTQLGHARLDVTATYLRGVGVDEVLRPIAERKAPMMAVA
jgi:site-specific recombinase XerD